LLSPGELEELAAMKPFERLQYREWERLQLFEELKRGINNLRLGDTRSFSQIAVGTLAVLLGGEIAPKTWSAAGNRFVHIIAASNLPEVSALFRDVLMPKINLFTKSEAEKKLIISGLLEYLISEFTRDINEEFLRVIVHEQEQFFQAIGYPADCG
jgi:hypothetical protein